MKLTSTSLALKARVGEDEEPKTRSEYLTDNMTIQSSLSTIYIKNSGHANLSFSKERCLHKSDLGSYSNRELNGALSKEEVFNEYPASQKILASSVDLKVKRITF